MNRGNIPGYYFDEEKKKYFKIVKTQYAPAGAKYSYDNYKKEVEVKNKRKRDRDEENRRKRQLIARPPILRNALATGIGSRSETGLRCCSDMLDLRSQAFVQGLEQRVLIDLSNLGQLQKEPTHIQSFEYDKPTRGIIIGTQVYGSFKPMQFLMSVLPSEEHSSSKRPKYSRQNLRKIMAFHSEISSVALTCQRTLITTTQGSTNAPDIHITTLLSPDHAEPTQSLDGPLSVSLKPKEPTTIWCSSTSPTSPDQNPETIALGTNQGILLLDNRRSTWKTRQTYQSTSDVLALSWLTPTILTGGLRTGGVIIYDTRSHGGIQRFTHPSTITKIKSLNDGHRIVVAGMASEMCIYDFRMLREETRTIRVGEGHWALDDEDGWGGGSSGGDLTWRTPFKKKVKSPKPVVKFRYNNTVYPLGMDVNHELGLVAAGEENGNIGIWSLRNGQRVRTLCRDEMGGRNGEVVGKRTGEVVEVKDLVRCLRFVDDEFGGPPRLMASAGSKIVEWAW